MTDEPRKPRPPKVIFDGRTGQPYYPNQDADWTQYEFFICALIVTMGMEATERYLRVQPPVGLQESP